MARRIVITVTDQMLRAWWTRNHPRGRMPGRRRAFFTMLRDLLFGWITTGPAPAPPSSATLPVAPPRAAPELPAPVTRTPIRSTAPPAWPTCHVGRLTT